MANGVVKAEDNTFNKFWVTMDNTAWKTLSLFPYESGDSIHMIENKFWKGINRQNVPKFLKPCLPASLGRGMKILITLHIFRDLI